MDVYTQHAMASGRRSTAKTSESDTRICGASNCTLHCCPTAVSSFAHNARHDYHGFSVSSFTHNAQHDCHMSWFVYSTAKTSESHTRICGASSCTGAWLQSLHSLIMLNMTIMVFLLHCQDFKIWYNNLWCFQLHALLLLGLQSLHLFLMLNMTIRFLYLSLIHIWRCRRGP